MQDECREECILKTYLECYPNPKAEYQLKKYRQTRRFWQQIAAEPLCNKKLSASTCVQELGLKKGYYLAILQCITTAR